MASSTSSTSISSSSEGAIPDDYVAFYQFEDNMNDATGNNNATPSNVTYSDTGGMPTLGKYGIFNGTTSYGQVTDSADVTDIKTCCCWIYLDSFGEGGAGMILNKGANKTFLYVLSSYFVFRKEFSTTDGEWKTPDSSIAISSWYHIAYTYAQDGLTSTNPQLYINGQPVTITESTTPEGTIQSDTGSDLFIGNRSGSDRTFDGRIDNLRLYNRVLTPTEIRSIYNEEAEGIESSSSSSSSESSSTEATFSTSSVSDENSSSSISGELSSSSSRSSSSSSTSSVNSTTSETSISESTTSNSTISESTTSETSLSTSSSSSNSSTSTSQSPSSANSTTSASSDSTSSLSSLDTTSESSETSLSTSSTSLSSSSSDETSLSTTSESSSNSSQSIDDLYVSDVIDRVRKLLNDPNATRYSNTNLIYWLSDAVRTVRKIRYESRLDSNGNLTVFSEITSIDDSLPIDNSWEECLVNYVCYRAFSEIKETLSSRERAPIYKELFYDSLGI